MRRPNLFRFFTLLLVMAGAGAAIDTSAQPIERVLLSLTNTWRYNQTTSYDGVNWTAPDFDDSTLPAGRGVLAVEDTGNTFVTSRTNTIRSRAPCGPTACRARRRWW